MRHATLPVENIRLDRPVPNSVLGESDPAIMDIIVTLNGSGPDHWVVVDGGRRFHDLVQRGVQTVDVKILEEADIEGGMDPEYVALLLNLDRSQNPVHESRMLRAWMDRRGLTQQDAADRLNVSQEKVSKLLALERLIPELRELCERGEIRFSTAWEISHLPNGNDPGEPANLQKEWLDYATEHDCLTLKSARQAVKAWKEGQVDSLDFVDVPEVVVVDERSALADRLAALAEGYTDADRDALLRAVQVLRKEG